MKPFYRNFDNASLPTENASSAGYTMIEVLIALAIFSIGIMAMGALQTSSLMSTGDIARKTMALALLDEQTETLKALPFYLTVAGTDYDGDGTTDGVTAHPGGLTAGAHNEVSPDGLFSINWQVLDDQPIPSQTDDIINSAPPKGKTFPAVSGGYTVSKTIIVWVNQAGSNAMSDALAIAEFVKVWVADGVQG